MPPAARVWLWRAGCRYNCWHDRSVVRLWRPPSAQMGIADYAVRGFIQPDRPASHDRLIAATPRAVRHADNE